MWRIEEIIFFLASICVSRLNYFRGQYFAAAQTDRACGVHFQTGEMIMPTTTRSDIYRLIVIRQDIHQHVNYVFYPYRLHSLYFKYRVFILVKNAFSNCFRVRTNEFGSPHKSWIQFTDGFNYIWFMDFGGLLSPRSLYALYALKIWNHQQFQQNSDFARYSLQQLSRMLWSATKEKKISGKFFLQPYKDSDFTSSRQLEWKKKSEIPQKCLQIPLQTNCKIRRKNNSPTQDLDFQCFKQISYVLLVFLNEELAYMVLFWFLHKIWEAHFSSI